MTTFTVWKFEDPLAAERAVGVLKDAQSDGLVKILDHAVVSWPRGEPKPTTHQAHEETWRGTGWGAFWGLLLGSLFLVPVIGGVAGAAIGAISKATEGVGITKEQLERIRTQVTEGTSALFVVTDQGDLDRLGERFHGMASKLIATNLTDAERQELLETFGGR
ncbi:putative membrane protein [Kribbella amoyensis]|uniref:Putative membrane protein n=1 Tax=Kribbella amoyensis TaxID=996641 RepID=A0A561BJV7_9ACTN|nr:DUF1269 domain-containing protein [Kribbella amoyensis]TWD79120.1 putative membrane protein [Kribbella amoyensis]